MPNQRKKIRETVRGGKHGILNNDVSLASISKTLPTRLPVGRPVSRNELDLTPAEMRIYMLIVEDGLCDREIAARIGWTRNSVKLLAGRTRSKVGATSRLKMAVQYWKSSAFIKYGTVASKGMIQ